MLCVMALCHAGAPAPTVSDTDWRHMRMFDAFWVQQCCHYPPGLFDDQLVSEDEQEGGDDAANGAPGARDWPPAPLLQADIDDNLDQGLQEDWLHGLEDDDDLFGGHPAFAEHLLLHLSVRGHCLCLTSDSPA